MILGRLTSVLVSGVLLAGCSTVPSDGPRGPEIVASGQTTPSGDPYAEVGVQFTTAGDFFALFSPSRWRNPIKTGGSLSWVNPAAWSDDAGRTGRILLGEAVVVGGVAVAVVAASDSGDDGGGSSSDGSGSGGGGPTTPTTPPGEPPTLPGALY